MGSHAFNIAAITAVLCRDPEAHDNPDKRWVSGVAAGIFYILVDVLGLTLAAVFMAFPATIITTLAGLTLLGTIGDSLASAMTDAEAREASLITFFAAADNISFLGIGLAAYAVLNGHLSR